MPNETLHHVILDTLAFLHYEHTRVSTFDHSPLDDFDHTLRVSWEAWLDNDRQGGAIHYYPILPEEGPLRRKVAFTLLVANHPAVDWLHAILRAHAAYGPIAPSQDVWNIGQFLPQMNMLEAVTLQAMHNVLAGVPSLEALPTTVELPQQVLSQAQLAALALYALERRRRELQAELDESARLAEDDT